MKWYFAINEAATSGGLGEHAKLAVTSALKHTSLEPHLLYLGQRNTFTEWMQAQGVTVLDVMPSYADALLAAADAGRYPHSFLGHWLRTEICNIETRDNVVLYTDIDAVFLDEVILGEDKPSFFACAPEFSIDNWSNFNSGVMLMNIPAMRADYPRFVSYIRWKFEQPDAGAFTDQTVYNEFYKGRWSRLDPIYNWKPYWNFDRSVRILHFHGPKIVNLHQIIKETWNWNHEFGRQVGSMFMSHTGSYGRFLRTILPDMDPAGNLYAWTAEVLAWIAAQEGPASVAPALAHVTCERCGLEAEIGQLSLAESYARDADFAATMRIPERDGSGLSCAEQEEDRERCRHLRSAIKRWLFSPATASA